MCSVFPFTLRFVKFSHVMPPFPEARACVGPRPLRSCYFCNCSDNSYSTTFLHNFEYRGNSLNYASDDSFDETSVTTLSNLGPFLNGSRRKGLLLSHRERSTSVEPNLYKMALIMMYVIFIFFQNLNTYAHQFPFQHRQIQRTL